MLLFLTECMLLPVWKSCGNKCLTSIPSVVSVLWVVSPLPLSQISVWCPRRPRHFDLMSFVIKLWLVMRRKRMMVMLHSQNSYCTACFWHNETLEARQKKLRICENYLPILDTREFVTRLFVKKQNKTNIKKQRITDSRFVCNHCSQIALYPSAVVLRAVTNIASHLQCSPSDY